jgi:predicted nucleic acid-binding protein
MTVVLDASVVIKWFLPEIDREAALRLRDSGESFVAPDHLFAETANAVWKKVRRREITAGEGTEAIERIDRAAVGIELVSCRELAVEAYKIAIAYGRSVYDAMYLALAKQRNTRLITADGRLFNALAAAPDIRPHIELLREYPS